MVRIRSRASGWMKAIICSTGRPCTVRVSRFAMLHPMRAEASWKAESCGWNVISSAGIARPMRAPTENHRVAGCQNDDALALVGL